MSQESGSVENVFGIHAVMSLLDRAESEIKCLWVLQGREDQRLARVIALAEKRRLKIKHVERSVLDRMVQGNHQGVIAESVIAVDLDEGDLENVLVNLQAPPFLLILDGVTDPHNLGACLRTADAAGVHAVIAPKDKSAPLNAVARKVACGAAEHVPYIRVTNLARTLRWLKQYGVWLTGTAGEAGKSLYESELTGAVALLMGAEGKGLRRLTAEHCDELVNIPMAGSVSSLNVSVATGVCLFEALRQRRLKALPVAEF